MKNNKGFTLIELLVVIAIIGVLASVVLASLNTARTKGNDAAIKANLSGIRAQAELYYDDATQGDGTYGTETSDVASTACNTGLFSQSNISDAIAAATSSSDGNAICRSSDNTTTAGQSAVSWAVSVPLKTSGAGHFCVDSAGSAKVVSSPVTAAADTDAAAAVCP